MYEYKILSALGNNVLLEDSLNEFGSEGWEIVGVNNTYIFLLRVIDEVDRLLNVVEGRPW